MSARIYRGPWPGITAATRLPAEPPTDAYLAERDHLGIPSHATALLRACPWCRARIGESCCVRATGWRLAEPHEARQVIAAVAS